MTFRRAGIFYWVFILLTLVLAAVAAFAPVIVGRIALALAVACYVIAIWLLRKRGDL